MAEKDKFFMIFDNTSGFVHTIDPKARSANVQRAKKFMTSGEARVFAENMLKDNAISADYDILYLMAK